MSGYLNCWLPASPTQSSMYCLTQYRYATIKYQGMKEFHLMAHVWDYVDIPWWKAAIIPTLCGARILHIYSSLLSPIYSPTHISCRLLHPPVPFSCNPLHPCGPYCALYVLLLLHAPTPIFALPCNPSYICTPPCPHLATQMSPFSPTPYTSLCSLLWPLYPSCTPPCPHLATQMSPFSPTPYTSLCSLCGPPVPLLHPL